MQGSERWKVICEVMRHRWCGWMDAVQPTTTQCRQDYGDLVMTPASYIVNYIVIHCRQRCHYTRLLSSRSGQQLPLWPFQEDARVQDNVGQYSPFIGCNSDTDVTRLRLFYDGLTTHRLNRLQSVLSAAAWLVYSAPRSEHVSPLLRHLHWLRVTHRTEFRLAVLIYRCLNDPSPSCGLH